MIFEKMPTPAWKDEPVPRYIPVHQCHYTYNECTLFPLTIICFMVISFYLEYNTTIYKNPTVYPFINVVYIILTTSPEKFDTLDYKHDVVILLAFIVFYFSNTFSTMTSTSNTAQRDYIKTQVEAFIERIGDTGTWNKEEALAELGDWIDMATFRVPRKTRAKEDVAPEKLCMARTWSSGCGGQCKKAKIDGRDFCKNCDKKHHICDTPASFNMDGTHKGLFWGRVDKPLPIKASDGKGIAIMWKTEEVKDEIRQILDDGGAWHPFCTERAFKTGDWDASPITTMTPKKKSKGKKKAGKKKSKRTKNAYLFFMTAARPAITANLRKFVEITKMVPVVGVHFLSENNNDIDAALASFKKVSKRKKILQNKLESIEIEGDGKIAENFVFKGKYAMGPIGKLGGALWGKMTVDEKQPFQDLADKAKTEASSSEDDSDTVMTSKELEKSDVEDGSDEPNSDDDEFEIEDVKLSNGTNIMVDDNDIIVNDDGEEIGTYDRETKEASYFEDDE